MQILQECGTSVFPKLRDSLLKAKLTLMFVCRNQYQQDRHQKGRCSSAHHI